MWIPWSLIFYLGMMFYKKEQEKFSVKPYFLVALSSGIFFIILHSFWVLLGKPLNLIDNKYPPNFYDLSYELFGTFIVFVLVKLNVFNFSLIKNAYTFLSKQSYSIFFIHIIILDLVITFKKNHGSGYGPMFEFFFVLLVSIVISLILKRLRFLYTKKE